MLLALLVLTATTLAHKEGDDHAAPACQSLQNSVVSPSSEGVGSGKTEGLVDVGLCALECGAKCFGGKGSHNFSPAKFRFGKIWNKLPFGKAICMSTCMLECTINQEENVKPELYRCTLGCAYKSAAITKLNGSDAHKGDNYLGSCYNKCEESYQG